MRPVVLSLLTIVNVAFALLSNMGFKWSALSADWRGFLTWQVVGNLAGFGSVIAFTLLLRLIPLHVAFGITTGLGFIAVQVVGANRVFHEPITVWGWVGSALILLGIVLISLRH
jgi:multidrug transporter EmrE-like cation transporter